MFLCLLHCRTSARRKSLSSSCGFCVRLYVHAISNGHEEGSQFVRRLCTGIRKVWFDAKRTVGASVTASIMVP